MRIRALAVFERVVYNAVLVDAGRPERPVLEVDALLRDGDAAGPILLPVPQLMAMLGGPDRADGVIRTLQQNGRLVRHDDVMHVSFPTWEFTPDD